MTSLAPHDKIRPPIHLRKNNRRQYEEIFCDPLGWTNERFIAWAQGIDLNTQTIL